MPVLTISAVDTATDQITSVAHGLLTGDGPFDVRNVGGGLPAPLAGVTDYYFIRVDADHGKIAASSADAMAGTAINLTTTGTGTQLLEIGIPYRRARTYTAGSQLKSADLDALQDSSKDLHAMFTGQAQSTWSFPFFTEAVEVPLGIDDLFDNLATCTISTHTRTGIDKLTFIASAVPVYGQIRGLSVGNVITGVKGELVKNTNNTNNFVCDVIAVNDAGETASGTAFSDSSNSPGVIAIAGGFNIVVQSGFRYYVKIEPGGGVTPAADVLHKLSTLRKFR